MTEVLTVGALGSTLLRRWKLIVLFAVLGAVAGTAYGVVSPKQYTAKAVLIVYAASSDNSGVYQAAQFAEKRAATYPTLLLAPEVVDATRQTLDLPYSSTALLALVTATNPTDTPAIEVTATSAMPTEAKEIADSIADNIADYAIELERSGARNTSVTIQKAVPAREPTSPTSPSAVILGGLGFLAGGALGILVALALRSIPPFRRGAGGAGDGHEAASDPLMSRSAPSTTASSNWTLTPRETSAQVPTASGSDGESSDSSHLALEHPWADAARGPRDSEARDAGGDDISDTRDGASRGPRAARRPATTVGRPTVRPSEDSDSHDGAWSSTRSR